MKHNPYSDLANAIIVQAANDYRKALRQLKRNPTYASARYTKAEVERFFHSEWFHYLTDADPDYIIEHLKRAEL